MSLFTILPVTVPDASLPQIPLTDVEFFGEGEQNSYDHWILNTSVASLVGIVNGRTLTPVATQPTYSATHINVPDKINNALKSTLFEPVSTGGYTMCKVTRYIPNGDITIAWGTLDSPASGTLTGGSTYRNNGGELLNTYRGTFSSTDTGLVAAENVWYFQAVSVQYTNATSMRIDNYLGGVGQHQSATSAGTYAPNTSQPLSLGNVDYGDELSSQDIAEFIVFDTALTLAEIAGVYLRSKARMASRGVIIT